MEQRAGSDRNRTRPGRRKRVPLGMRNVLVAPKKEGYVRRFVNDVEDRVATMQERGYEIVRKSGDIETGDPKVGKDSVVGSPVVKSVGGGIKAVLMEIPKEWYDEDQLEKQKEIDSLEDSMKQTGEMQYGKVKIEKR